MSEQIGESADIRLQPSGNEAGTAPEDRRFRPDIQGLRAVAVLLVVLFHAGVPHLSGGNIGVDVFFVISGFVITGLLLRERQADGSNSIVGFYARRVRRILPAATICILASVGLTFALASSVAGKAAAGDGRWAAIFLYNFHYATTLPVRSVFANFWSLSVEEQFYVVYPTLVVVVALVAKQIPLRLRLGAVLGVGVAASYIWSLASSHNATVAFVSPFTRAWELALGGLLALATPVFRRMSGEMAALVTWVGMGMILFAATMSGNTAHPGSLGALGAALVIGAGTAVPAFGAERLLALPPFAWIGDRSYSWYLWHFPLLVIVADHEHTPQLSVSKGLAVVAVALVVAALSYSYVENPVRHLRLSPWRSVAMGGVLIGVTLIVLTAAIAI